MPDALSRCRGMMLGLAIGDAVGATNEFKSPDEVTPISDMVGGGPFLLPAGYWTDDTSMALCIADSILEKNAIDPVDQMFKYCDWYSNGTNSPTGVCFDIGYQTKDALKDFINQVHISTNPTGFYGRTDFYSSGNGALMRLAPAIIYARKLPFNEMVDVISDCTRTTHASIQCIESSIVLAERCISAMGFFDSYHSRVFDYLTLPDTIDLYSGNYAGKTLSSRGYCIDSLRMALYYVENTSSFEECILKIANLGEDSDTNCAIAGQLAGAYYGIDGIPTKWIEKLAWSSHIDSLACKLFEIAPDKLGESK